MTMTELAASYRSTAERIYLRIKLVEGLPTRGDSEKLLKQSRLRLLRDMYRDTCAVAAVCSHYYDRDCRINSWYRL